jgi:hypothetical protein
VRFKVTRRVADFHRTVLEGGIFMGRGQYRPRDDVRLAEDFIRRG